MAEQEKKQPLLLSEEQLRRGIQSMMSGAENSTDTDDFKGNISRELDEKLHKLAESYKRSE